MKNLTYEEAIEKIENILEQLEEEELTLENHMKLFEEAIELHKHCTKILNKTEKTIELILKDEKIEEKEFELEE